jgi:hypothetical protein
VCSLSGTMSMTASMTWETARERAGNSHKGQGIHTSEPGNDLGVVATEPDSRWAGNSEK